MSEGTGLTRLMCAWIDTQARGENAELKRKILVEYMATPEGRLKVLEARYGAAFTSYSFNRTKFRSRPEEYLHPWEKSDFHRTDVPFLACIPEDERGSDAYLKLADLVEQARGLYAAHAEATGGKDHRIHFNVHHGPVVNADKERE